jgi:hypothetical protein
MSNTSRTLAPALIGAFLLACTVAVVGSLAVWGQRVEVRMLVAEGKPLAVAECMVQLRQSWGECEVGMFTGTYLAAWDSLPELRAVRDAVAGLRRRGGEWTFASHHRGRAWQVCASLPAREPVCAVNVQTAISLALGEPVPPTTALAAMSPGSRRLCTGAAAAELRRALQAARSASQANRARAALQAQAHACGTAAA